MGTHYPIYRLEEFAINAQFIEIFIENLVCRRLKNAPWFKIKKRTLIYD